MNELNNPETYVLTHNRFNTYKVLIFTDLKKLRFIKSLIEIALIKKLGKLRALITCMYLDRMKTIKMEIFYSKSKIKSMLM